MGPQSYLLKAYEELWVKELSEDVENILKWALGIYSLTNVALISSNKQSFKCALQGLKEKSKYLYSSWYKLAEKQSLQTYMYIYGLVNMLQACFKM